MSQYLLTKLLPHGSNFLSDSAATKVNINASDVAAALGYGSLSKYACYMGLAKYCADIHASQQLLAHFERKIQRTITRKKWHDSMGRAKGLAILTLSESMHSIKCKHCKGHGTATKRNKINSIDERQLCKACLGTGNKQLSATQKSKIAQISTSSWTRTWKLRHDSFKDYADELECKAIKHLKKQLIT